MSYAAPETTEAPPATVAPLGFADLCDSCGAQAYVRVTLESGELFILWSPRFQAPRDPGLKHHRLARRDRPTSLRTLQLTLGNAPSAD